MCQGIAKTLLIGINMVFLLISLALMAAGVILAFMPDIIMATVFDQVNSAVSGLASSEKFQLPASASELSEVPLAYQVGVFLFAFGLALFIISFLGCCGACCSCCKVMLLLFAIVMIVLLLIEVTFFGLFLTEDSPLHGEIKSSLADKISDPYDENNPSTFDLMMNIINYNFKCCGLRGRSDYNVMSGVTVAAGAPALTEPLSCKKQGVGATGYYQDGCYDDLQDLIQDNIIYAGLAAGGLCLLQLLEVIFAIVIFKDSGKVSPV